MTMRRKCNILLLILFFAALYSASAQSNKTVCNLCSFLVTIAPPQLLLNESLSQAEVDLVLRLAARDGHILRDGTVGNRAELAKLALMLLDRKELGLAFGSAPSDRAVLVGYILEVDKGSNRHYALTGTDRSIVYNPCDADDPTQTSIGVYVFAN